MAKFYHFQIGVTKVPARYRYRTTLAHTRIPHKWCLNFKHVENQEKHTCCCQFAKSSILQIGRNIYIWLFDVWVKDDLLFFLFLILLFIILLYVVFFATVRGNPVGKNFSLWQNSSIGILLSKKIMIFY